MAAVAGEKIRVKICGLTDPQGIDAAVMAGASYIGLVQFPRSPRHVDLATAAALAARVPEQVIRVALVVNADNETLDQLTSGVPLDMLQLHGSEPPERVSEVKARYGLPVIKAVGIAESADLAQIDRYARVSDQLLIDTKPPKGADRPGGNAARFDWSLIAGRSWSVPWMLAGGLTADNVTEAIRMTGATQIDVSSGVESAPGVKSPELIRAFVKAAQM